MSNDIENKIYKTIQEGVDENLKHDILDKTVLKNLKQIVYRYIKDNNLIIVGDEAIKFFRPREYKEIELRDLDKIKNLPITVHVYSPNAITDAKKLGGILHELGYQHISISEIAEYKTYVLDVEFKTVVKFSYINLYYFRNIPVVEQNKLKYITPEFLLLGIYYKYITPRINVEMWKANIAYEKALFDKELFRTDKVRNKLKPLFKNEVGEEHLNLMTKLLKYLKGNDDCILTGLLAYNLMINGTDGDKSDEVKNVSYLSVMCDGLGDRVDEIMGIIGAKKCEKIDQKKLRKMRNTDCPEFSIEETQPLLIYFGEGRKIYYEGKLLIELVELPTCFNYNLTNNGLKIANFHQLIWFLLIQKFYTFDRNVVNNYRLLINTMIKKRIAYLNKNGLSGLEKGVMQVFQGDCVGPNVNYKFLYHLGFWEGTRRFRFRF